MDALKPSENARLADYFVICGLDASADLEMEAQTENDLSDSVTPLERSFKCRVLAHYPDYVPWNSFDEKAVRMVSPFWKTYVKQVASLQKTDCLIHKIVLFFQLCMPGCVSFRTEKRVTSPKYHTFLITREDGTRYYGYALTFFEEVTESKICRAIETLQVNLCIRADIGRKLQTHVSLGKVISRKCI